MRAMIISAFAALLTTQMICGVEVPPGHVCVGWGAVADCTVSQNTCGGQTVCQKVGTVIECDCKAGFVQGPTKDCVEPCSIANVCGAHSTCTSTDGKAVCGCEDGFLKSSTGACLSPCDDGNNGGCGNMQCTASAEGPSCACAAITSSNENHLLARGKTVTMSSLYSPGYKGSLAVDGIKSSASIAITQATAVPWMQIDLGESRCVTALEIWNRIPYSERFKNVRITVGDTDPPTEECAYFPGQPANVQRFDCTSVKHGRYVRVTQENKAYLNLFEIEVIGV